MDSGKSLDVSQNSGKAEASYRRCTSSSIATRVTPSLARVKFFTNIMNVPLDWEHSKGSAGRTLFVNTETQRTRSEESVCQDLPGNWGQSQGFSNHGLHRNHGKRRLWFPCVRRVPWWNSRLVTEDSPWVWKRWNRLADEKTLNQKSMLGTPV
jgi:hypothetical protein